jgi:hypothetical protein
MMVSVSLLTRAALPRLWCSTLRRCRRARFAGCGDPVKEMAIAVLLAGIFATLTAQCVREYKQNKIFGNAIATIP